VVVADAIDHCRPRSGYIVFEMQAQFPPAAPRHRPLEDIRDTERHRAALAVEIRRLERSLLLFGPMPKERLARAVRAERWREGTFEEAVQEGVRTGKLHRLPLEWVAITHR
jgi:hypothetical protein